MRKTVLACLLALGLTAGCGGASGPSGKRGYAPDGTFTMILSSDVGTFDPYHSQSIFSTAYFAYDPLIWPRPDGGFVSGLAKTWNADARSATFDLRQGVTCSDGTPLTATQVAEAINYVADPGNKSPQYGTTAPTVPLTAVGDDAAGTVKVSMKKPFGFLLEMISQLPIVCAKGLENPAMFKTASAGTGPFVLTKVVPGASYTFTRRADYVWGPDGAGANAPGVPKTVVLRIVENETTASNLLLSGEANFARITGADQQRLDAQGLKRLELPMSGAWLWFNQADGRATADPRVRKALVQALDIEEIIKVNTGGRGRPATGIAPMEPNPCDGTDVTRYLPPEDVASARRLLDEAGWRQGAGGERSKDGRPLHIDLHYVSTGSVFNEPTATLLAKMWESVGAKVDLTGDTSTGLSRVMFETRDYEVYMQGFGFNMSNQMVPYLSGAVPPDGVNSAGIKNDTYMRLAAQAATKAGKEACAHWARAEQSLYQAIDVAPIADRPMVYYLKNAEARSAGFSIPLPSSIRVLR